MKKIPQRILRMTSDQHGRLKQHLLPGDGLEAVAIALCGRRCSETHEVLSIHKILLVPYEVCERMPLMITWPTEYMLDLIKEATKKKMAIVKMHSHPGDYDRFSEVDDRSDNDLFPSLHGWTGDGLPHASAVMLQDGRVFGRFAYDDGTFAAINRIAVVGDDLFFFDYGSGAGVQDSGEQLRTRQAFGDRTTSLLHTLRIGIVGCSGTGSWVAEQLGRLGVGELILVDPDRVEHKNLNRIIGTCRRDADDGRFKVEVIGDRLKTYGTVTKVITFAKTALNHNVVHSLAMCDVLFGCMDSVEGRDLLNRVAVFYSIPYFDLGIQLRADGKGNVETVCGSVHYLVPDGSSLLSRGVYTPEMLRAESLKRTDPERYEIELEEGYVRGVAIGSPAVISVNGFCATMAVNEFLARLHPFRIDPNRRFRWQQFDIVNSIWQPHEEPCGGRCQLLSRFAGRGDMNPLLNCNLVET